MAHHEPPHQDLHCLQILLFASFVLKELTDLVVLTRVHGKRSQQQTIRNAIIYAGQIVVNVSLSVKYIKFSVQFENISRLHADLFL